MSSRRPPALVRAHGRCPVFAARSAAALTAGQVRRACLGWTVGAARRSTVVTASRDLAAPVMVRHGSD